MNSLVPHLKLRMLCFEHRCARGGMFPVFELLLVIKSENVLDQKSFGPRIDQALLWTTEVIFIVTLPANVGPHLLPRGLLIYVVVLNALRSFQGAHAFYECRTRDAQLHRLRIMAIDTRDRMSDGFTSFEIRHLVQCLEAFDNVAAAELLVCDIRRGMTVDARAGLFRNLLTLGERLIIEHIRMTAFFPEIFRKRISRPDDLQARILFEARLRDYRTRIGLRGRAWLRFAAAIACADLIHCL